MGHEAQNLTAAKIRRKAKRYKRNNSVKNVFLHILVIAIKNVLVMKRFIPTLYVVAILAVTAIGCNKAKNCECAVDIANEIIDSAAWHAAGEPFYMCKNGEPLQPKTFLYDTLLQSGDCESMNYFDTVGVTYPEEGLCLHNVRECFEK